MITLRSHILYILGLLIVSLFGCAGNAGQPISSSKDISNPGGLSYGMIKRDLVVGQSTQEDVIKKFGSPNNMVYKGKGGELWIYDQIQTESTSQVDASRSGVTVGGYAGGAGGGAGVLGGVQNSNSVMKNTSSIRTLTVILEFNEKGVLLDVSARQGGY